MYSDSDDDYDDAGRYRFTRPSCFAWPPLRLHQFLLRLRKESAHGTVKINPDGRTEKDIMRAYRLQYEWCDGWDWRCVTVERFFDEMKGFHTGCLDLSGRFPQRYDALYQRWKSLHASFIELDNALQDAKDEDEEGVLWRQFCAHWKINLHWKRAWVHQLYSSALSVVEAHPKPMLQKIYLQSLPTEILQMVFECADMRDARSLSSTSQYMRQAALQIIFQSRTITIPLPQRLAEGTDVNEEAFSLLLDALDKAIDDVEFLLARPDIHQRIRHLHVENAWISGMQLNGVDVTNRVVTDPSSEVYAYFHERLCQLLRVLTLRSLALSDIYICDMVVQHLASQPELLSLVVNYCTPSIMIDSPKLAVTCLHLEFSAAEPLWDIVALCPHLRQLYVKCASRRTGFLAPPSRLWSRLDVLNDIERLHLEGIYPDPQSFTEWFTYATSFGRFSFTHVKFSSHSEMWDDNLRTLLDAIRMGLPPLRVLAIEGLAQCSLALFDTISEHFSDLVGLTLIRRASSRQLENKMCRWPHALYEYAYHMRGLTKLRHFGANFRLNFFAASPAGFDKGAWLGQEPEFAESWIHTVSPYRDDFQMYDESSAALAFAGYCPALEAFLLTAAAPWYGCRIRRMATTGGITVKEVWLGSIRPFEDVSDFEGWNPGASETWDPPPKRG
ncbi:hypothetical protein EXIGLDRAFT_79227 [Exidia glandulosa HHB12029]|uniref:F-box domain-containing protein n=1 Tax=Exidia glandulosa HHB12029 TaxID=1314781 RepID=A0A166AIU4_EXIGL|nr:hypothetical protein EXIGLDRAFT_79227 [Exidia glandulosa HHB12029]